MSKRLYRSCIIAATGLFASLAALPLHAVDASANAPMNDGIDRTAPNFVKASLLVVDPGEIMYSCFGHAVIRLECPKFDLDYCFSYESEGILENKWRFFRGDLKMGMFAVPTEEFLKPYVAERRGVKQYALNLPADAKQRLWKYLDGKVAEGVNLKYDQVERCCAQSVYRQILHAADPLPVRHHYWPEGFVGDKTRREIAREFLAGLPWTSFVMSAVSGSTLDEQCSEAEKIIIPRDTVAVLQRSTVNGTPILDVQSVQLLPAHPLKKPIAVTPMMIACVTLALSVVNLFVAHWALDVGLLALYSVFAFVFSILVGFSALPTNGWNWMLVPFNPLPIVLWRWRRTWGGGFAAFLGVFALMVAGMSHRITEWPYVVFIAAFAILFAKPLIRRAFLDRTRAGIRAADGQMMK